MKKRFVIALGVFLLFIALMSAAALWADGAAAEVRDGVLRFHIVANSDLDADQQNKFAVRDGIAQLCSRLFEGSESKAQSMEIAEQSSDIITQQAEQILRERGCDMAVSVTVRERFFPTRHYEGVSLPAGVYDTVDVQIGSAQGQNFWCVMFPDICLGSAAESNSEKMGEVLSQDAHELVTKDTPTVKFKFKLIEIIQNIKNLW